LFNITGADAKISVVQKSVIGGLTMSSPWQGPLGMSLDGIHCRGVELRCGALARLDQAKTPGAAEKTQQGCPSSWHPAGSDL